MTWHWLIPEIMMEPLDCDERKCDIGVTKVWHQYAFYGHNRQVYCHTCVTQICTYMSHMCHIWIWLYGHKWSFLVTPCHTSADTSLHIIGHILMVTIYAYVVWQWCVEVTRWFCQRHSITACDRKNYNFSIINKYSPVHCLW